MHKHLEQKYFGRKDILHAENTAKKLRKAVYQLFQYYSQQKTNNLLHLYPILKTNWIGAALELQISCLHGNCRIHHSSKSSNWIIWNCISEIFHQKPCYFTNCKRYINCELPFSQKLKWSFRGITSLISEKAEYKSSKRRLRAITMPLNWMHC